MDQLLSNLQAAHRKHVSDSVWTAVEAVEHTLATFREQVNAGTLVFVHHPTPHYIFSPTSGSFDEKPAAPGSWERYSDFVLDVIRSSTGMRVEWSPGSSIALHLPEPCAGVPLTVGPCPGAQTKAPAAPCALSPGMFAGLSPGRGVPPGMPPELFPGMSPELLLGCSGLGDGVFSCAGGPAEGPAPPFLAAMLKDAVGRAHLPGAGTRCGTLEIDGHFGLTASFDPKAPAAKAEPAAVAAVEPPSPPRAVDASPSPKAECPPKTGSASKSARPDNLDTGSPCCPPTATPTPVTLQFTGTGTVTTGTGTVTTGTGTATPGSAAA